MGVADDLTKSYYHSYTDGIIDIRNVNYDYYN